MAQINEKLLSEISEAAVKLDWEESFDGKSYGNRHLFRVNKIANFLQEKEGGDRFIVLAGAWVHDVSLVLGNDDDPDKIFSETKKFLSEFEFDENIKVKIAKAVSTHENAKAATIESQIIHDADVLDKLGILGFIRHVWKVTNMIKGQIVKDEEDFRTIINHIKERKNNLHTKTAKLLADELNESLDSIEKNSNHLDFLKNISEMAYSGKTTEQICEKLDDFQSLVSWQLNQDYLLT